MRLTNRTKTWAEASRRFWGERKDAPAEGLREAERSALMEPAFVAHPSAPEPEPMPNELSAEVSALLSGDPTQQLLTALGRFQRQVNVADSGAPAEAWVDNCIDQLISGIQIAHVRGWKGVKEALTDTARVLQSYDEGGDASGCVAFLQDAYEILCLMVGDLIVDNVRSGVMDKWRERYARAVSDLEQSGYSLIDDDTGVAPPPVRVPMPVVSGKPTNVTPFVPRAMPETAADEAPGALSDTYADVDSPDVTYGAADDAFADDDVHYVDEPAYLAEPMVEVTPFESAPAEAAWEDEVAEEAEVEETVVYVEEDAEVEYEEEIDSVPADMEDAAFDVEESSPFDAVEVDVDTTEVAPALDLGDEMYEEEDAPSTVHLVEADTTTPEAELLADEMMTETLEEAAEEEESWLVLPEADASVDAEPESDPFAAVEEEVATEAAPAAPIVDRAETAQFLFDELAETPMEEPAVEVTYLDEVVEEDPFTVVADLLNTSGETESPVAEEAIAAEAEVAEPVPAAAPVVAKQEDTPEALLRHAQAAMMRGDVRDAKVLALQLAANMAKLEAQKAVQIVQDAITRLAETDHAIEVAHSDVTNAEQRLQDTTRIREEREHEIDVKKSGIHGLEKRVDSVESSIEKLEEQIARLRAQHEQELERLAEVQADLEVEREQERMLLEDLDRLFETEQAATDTLELARTRAEQLRQQRLEREQAREACEQMLARQRESAEGIERTLEAVVGKAN